jgi:hydrogenase nickel incorporation protein HypA/HybF
MHELAVTESILEIALRHAEQANAGRITDLYLVIGQLASIVDDSVSFYWDLISADTVAQGATLHFRRIPTEMQCQECSTKYQPSENDFTCPTCSSAKIKIISGEEFFLEAIHVDNNST